MNDANHMVKIIGAKVIFVANIVVCVYCFLYVSRDLEMYILRDLECCIANIDEAIHLF